MTPHLHPSEVRAPAPGKRAVRKRLRALQIGVAAAAVAASFAAAAYVVTQLPEEEPAPKVTFNRIEDWPEIKNGVPARLSPAPEPPPIAASAPAAPVADEPGKTRERAAEAEMPAGSAVAASAPASPAAAEATAPPVAPPAAKIGKARASGASPTGVASPRPTPPAKTAPAKTAKAKSRPAKVASASPAEAPPAPPASPPAPPEDDRVHVLGLSLPNLLPSGRKIREAVQSLGL
jgi:hypothetical protein